MRAKITKLSNNGVECRETLDTIIDNSSALQNIGQAYLHWKMWMFLYLDMHFVLKFLHERGCFFQGKQVHFICHKSIKHYPIGSQGNHWLVLDKQIESHADSILFFSWESNASHRHTVEILETDQRSGTLKK